MTDHRFIRKIALFMAIQTFCFQWTSIVLAYQGEQFDPHTLSVAILSYPSNPKVKDMVDQAAEGVRERLEKIPYFHVVSKEAVTTVADYQADQVRDEPNLTDAEKNLGVAKTNWFDQKYPEAEKLVTQAIEAFRQQPSKGDLLVDALLTKALILQETNRYDESKVIFDEALKVNPNLTMEGLPITGRSRRVFNDTRKVVLERTAGSLDIKTDPPAVAIYLNGIKKGVTPLVLNQIPEGNYLLTLEASHYTTINKPIVVTSSTTQFINEKLYWLNGRSADALKKYGVPVKTDNVLQNEIKMAVKVGESLKVDKVILVSTEHKGNDDLLVMRTIDTTLKAAYNPIGMPITDFQSNTSAGLDKMASELDHQARINVLNNPEEYFDPDLGDIRVLRRKRPFTKTPLFYTLVGLVVGGAIGTTAGILLSSSDSTAAPSGSTSGVNIQFK